MNIIEKCAEWLWRQNRSKCKSCSLCDVFIDTTGTWSNQSVSRHIKADYKFEIGELLTTFGLTDTQIEALGEEDTRLVVVYKEGRLPYYQYVKGDEYIPEEERRAMEYGYNLSQQDMLAQGWVKKVEE